MFLAFAGGAIGVRAGFEESVELAAHYGFDGVATDTGYLMQNGPETVVQMLEERNLRPGSWGLPVALMGAREDFEKQLAALAPIAEGCARAADLRTATWVSPTTAGKSYDEAYEMLRSRVEKVAAVLYEHDVRLGLEFIGPATSRKGRDFEFIHDMDTMLGLTRSIPTGNVGLLLDAWHLYTAHGKNEDVLELADADVVLVHINDAPAGLEIDEQIDNKRCLPGETGVIGVDVFLSNLQEIGYSGPVIVEPFSAALNEMAPDDAIRAVKDAVDGVWPD